VGRREEMGFSRYPFMPLLWRENRLWVVSDDDSRPWLSSGERKLGNREAERIFTAVEVESLNRCYVSRRAVQLYSPTSG
jgi:hypothetical protein